tara:strand:- start:187964 stop:189454 length:1491 start_codon:yes stop_codon:yes gene_type:complete
MRFNLRFNAFAAFILLGMATLSGCTTNPATGEQSFTGFMSVEDEQKVGAEEHPKMLKAFGGTYSDAELQAYVQAIGQKLAKQSEIPNQRFQFFVLNDDTVNAFALPGGYVYVSRGLVTLAEDEAELAGVIGHEIGHVAARHSAQRYSSQMATQIGVTAVSIIGAVLGAPNGVGNIVSLGAQAALQSYSRSQELEADRLGIRYISKAGYNTDALGDFFAKLDAQTTIAAAMEGKAKGGDSIMSTHPRTIDRIQQAKSLAADAMPANAARARNPFLNQLDGVMFGPDPKEGFMKSDTFIHPGIGFSFDFPPEFTVKNGDAEVFGQDGKGTEVIFSMANADVASGYANLTDYLRGPWAKESGFQPDNLERLTINGYEGVSGTSRGETKFGTRDIRFLAIRTSRNQIFRFVFLTDPSVTSAMSVPLRRTTYSFKLLNPADIDQVRPPVIRVVDVKPGATVSGFASRMPLGKYNEDWFRALNLNAMANGLKAGEKVKIVAD